MELVIDHRVSFESLMRAQGLSEAAIRSFFFYYAQLQQGHHGMIAETELNAVHALPRAQELPASLIACGQRASGKNR